MDIKEILDDLNPSPKVMKWIIVILSSIITSSYIYEKIVGEDNDDKINELIQQNINYKNRISNLENANKKSYAYDQYLNNKINGSIDNVKTYFDKRIEFIVSNQDSKNKKFILSVLNMSNITSNSLIPANEKINETIEDTIKINDNEEIISEPIESIEPIKTQIKYNVNETIKVNKKDSSQKKNFIKKILGI